MTKWNYRVLQHRQGEETWYALHEVHYDEDGKPRSYTESPSTFLGEAAEGPEGIAAALRTALKDAEAHPVLDAESDFPPARKG